MARRSPPEKKRLSYAKDRRNVYGENAKASRKNLPKKRSRTHRTYRRTVRQELAHASTEVSIEWDDAQTRTAEIRREKFKKEPDAPLGEVVERKLRRRGVAP